MTVKQITKMENGRLVPTTDSLDADLVEISKEAGNVLEVKEDGLYYKPKVLTLEDGLEYRGDGIGLSERSIPTSKLTEVSATVSNTELPADTLQSIENHLSNLYGYIQRLKGTVDESTGETLYNLKELSTGFEMLQERLVRDYYTKTAIDSFNNEKVDKSTLGSYYTKEQVNSKVDTSISTYDSDVAFNKYRLKSEPLSTASLYNATSIATSSPKIFAATAVANSDGDWSIDYSHVGFTQIPIVTATGQSAGTALGDKRFASLNAGQPTKTGCSGKLVSSSSAGLLAAMTMVNGAGTLNIIAIGY